ncbi:Sterol 3-beta-glucosyltransferase [Exophiala xenobiotica]|uniref:Sterol 3-beta-glucosyltransferase n=1 Tax=Lithohypha guttulata TaxID=1690604 RepID=A0ABR0JT82_9EURO|nr:Sterol 3-beta-glucosyltransferase [Lithohypha guttulata]KAK5308997.1 Sterol 3-beta-glucosyltransferase [Exophiala xenobiotica]
MSSPEVKRSMSASKKLQKRGGNPHRVPSYQLPSRLRFSEDAQEDVAAPTRATGTPAQYMNQSIFGMIAAAGSRTDFNQRFDESSDSDGETATKDRSLSGRRVSKKSTKTVKDAHPSEDDSKPSDAKRTKRLSLHRLAQSVPKLSLKTYKSRQPSQPRDLSPSNEEGSDEDTGDPRDAPMMSRLLTAEAAFEATEEGIEEQGTLPMAAERARSRAESSPATLLATRLKEIFGFERPETVVAEFPCWLLQSVLLQGYLYLTTHHICFYAYLPKKSSAATKTGHLSKRGKSNPKYRRYWFELKGDVLSYYTNPSARYFPQGNIDLRYGISASLADDKDKECKDFAVTTDHRTYYFKADSAVSAREWVKTIQKTIFRSHNDGDSVKISLPTENIIDIEESPVVDLAETIKFRVVENDDSYAIDEYFFSFSFGLDVMRTLRTLFEDSSSRRASIDLLSPVTHDGGSASARWPPPGQRMSMQGTRDASSSPVRESVRATLTPYTLGRDGKMTPRMSGEFSRSSHSPARMNLDQQAEYGRQSFDRGRRSESTNRLELGQNERRQARSPLARPAEDSRDSYVAASIETETDSPTAAVSPAVDANMSASQILSRSDVFRAPPVRRMSTLMSDDTEDESKILDEDRGPVSKPGNDRRIALRAEAVSDQPTASSIIPRTASPTLQDIVKAGAYPLQRAGAFAGYLKNRSEKMSKLLATESMSYLEKVSGMWAGQRKHYGEKETVVPDDRDVDPEDEEANVGHGDRFRAHFALPSTEKLQATYFGFFHRVLPLYGKVYISNSKFCFRSLLPGTRTKLILPLKDIENVDKEKGFRFGYHGLVLVIRGHEELFFEFSSIDNRDDCTITLLKSLESVRYLAESGLLSQLEAEAAEAAKIEHIMLQEARRGSGVTGPETPPIAKDGTTLVSEEITPIIFDDGKASIINFKPPTGLRITCLTIGSRGDVQPYIALCKGLLAEGHKPRIATHAEFGPWVEKHGIDFVSVGGDPAELMRICVENGMFTYSFLKEATSKFRTWIDELLESAWSACQDSDILIESPSAMAGIHIAEALGIPYFRAFTMPWTRTRAYPHAFAVPEHKYGGAYNYLSYVMFDNVFWKGVSGQINRWRKRDLHLGSTNLERMQQNKVPFLYNYSPHVVPPPLDYSDWVRVTGYWFLDEGGDYAPPQELDDFIRKARDDGKKLVYIGFGSIVVADPAALTKTVVEAVQKADVRCILSKGWSDRLGDPSAQKVEVPLPPEIFKITAAPHDWLFKQIDAAVHHGGAGTTGASLRAGIPTVTKPFFGDQFFFGSRLEDLGVGICLKRINVSVLARALWEAVHSQRMITKARLLGEQIRSENGVQHAIQAIYRDLEYAQTLIRARKTQDQEAVESSPATKTSQSGSREPGVADEQDEESWTFVDDSDESRHTQARSVVETLAASKREC